MQKKDQKKSIMVLFGGVSAEHDVSIISAQNVINFINKKKYKVVPIYIDKKGRWLSFEIKFVSNKSFEFGKVEKEKLNEVFPYSKNGKMFINAKKEEKIDIVFPVLHGPYGEDGSMQGFLRILNVPFVGSGVLGSAVGMDKDFAKRLLRDAGILVGDFVVIKKDQEKIDFFSIKRKFGLPVFIKPANMGSSVGISKVNNKEEFFAAVNKAFEYDEKVIIEKNIKGREVECAILGNEKPQASIVGEVLVKKGFYSYSAKYLEKDNAEIVIPAKITNKTLKKIQETAIKTFQVLGCSGFARVDFFLCPNGRVFVNEINTIPGFTSISMYPKLWQESGIKYEALIEKLIILAFEQHKKINSYNKCV
ncbi:MAG: D-alanine--D-alanine ligase [Patescibacteria group bacterium]